MGLVQLIAPTAEPVSLAEMKDHLRVDGTDEDVLITGLIPAARHEAEIFTRRQLVAATWKLTLDEWPDEVELPYPPLLSVSEIAYVDENGDNQTLATSEYTVDTNRIKGRIVPAYGETWPTVRDHIEVITITYIAGYGAVFTVTPASNTLTVVGRVPVDGDIVMLQNIGGESGALPTGLSANTNYYIIESSGQACKLSLTAGGDAVGITEAGTGTHFLGVIPEAARAAIKLMVADLFEHREARIEAKVEDNPTVERLLWQLRVLEGP